MDWFREGENCEVVSSAATAAAAGFDPAWPGGINTEEDVGPGVPSAPAREQESLCSPPPPERNAHHLRRRLSAGGRHHTWLSHFPCERGARACEFVCVSVRACVPRFPNSLNPQPRLQEHIYQIAK